MGSVEYKRVITFSVSFAIPYLAEKGRLAEKSYFAEKGYLAGKGYFAERG
jgi:hypothetical protein